MCVQSIKSGVEMLAYAPDGRTLCVADVGRRVTERDTVTRTGRELFTMTQSAKWGMFCATGGRFLVIRFAVGKRVTCAAFSPDGLTCVVGRSNKQFAVFDIDVRRDAMWMMVWAVV